MASLRWMAAVCAAVALSACASSKPPKPPPPTAVGPDDPCTAYCLVWVPPQCREVPHLVCCKQPTKCETVFKKEVGALFDAVAVARPEATREQSFEVYVVGKGFHG